MAKLAIRTDQLTREFGPLRAVDDLTIEVPEGIIFGFLGPNGAGKTTTINILLGLIEPTKGGAELLGFDVREHSQDIRALSGALLEYPGLYEQLSAADNLEFYGRIWRLTRSEIQVRIKDLLTQIGLWERRGERLAKWSRGMKQKLALARTLIHHPRLIFLDEPTAGLDVMAAATIRDDITNMAREEGVTFFITTHNMTEAEKLCHEVAVIRQGRLVAVGQPEELRRHAGSPRLEIIGKGFNGDVINLLEGLPDVSSVELKEDQLTINFARDIDTAPLVNRMVASGVQIDEVRKGKASLEEVFITLMEEEK